MAFAACSRDLNQLLVGLPSADWNALRLHLEWVELPQGAVLYESGEVLRHVYFPVTAVVSLVSSMKSGATAEVAVVGNEGVVGVCAFLGGGSSHSGAVVQRAGHGLRMSAQAIADQANRSPALSQQLLGYTQALLTHMTQTSACHRHHDVDQQLCRWLLLHLDRQPGQDLHVTHERIAGLLGVRREGVTCGALKLRKAGLIDYRRGRVSVLDRHGLEALSCECYAVVRQAYDRLSAAAAPRPVELHAAEPRPMRPMPLRAALAMA
ncbi:Crp/Fnr family transcriptional regulator [Rhizobacter sp. AJA081-3]|uniref:Crp/Fnr family transcriptional regulator n=1 Tax=Rhizobacter sp. AJA081-3 TaxID=2753607 RepID=UPI001ADF1625|nr:Crp/Fnr family transcriptional regulator [Rhizobacter sp. AJA081-3]QTN21659.1 Crp/Fnr family transcriptional regulator [Rhizobacter sp. AJA081-3]